MHATADRLDFAPPPQPGMLRAFALAVFAHLLLVAALMHGLQWKRDTQEAVAEAELWSRVPQQAAPREVVPPPAPPAPPPAPVVKPAPPPPPVVKAPPQPEPPVQREPDIALEREKERQKLKREAERRELEQQKRELELQKRELEKQKQAELERERDRRRKLEAQKKQREEDIARKKEEQAKEKARLVAEAKRKEAERKRKEEQEAREAKRLEELREANIKRSLGMAGTGAPDSAGNAARSSGPSASWGARVQARVKPNIVFSDNVTGNPEAVIEVRLAPDGTIVSKRVKKSSGHKAWDEAVIRALDRTEVLPRDTDGRVPPTGDLVFRPKG